MIISLRENKAKQHYYYWHIIFFMVISLLFIIIVIQSKKDIRIELILLEKNSCLKPNNIFLIK